MEVIKTMRIYTFVPPKAIRKLLRKLLGKQRN
jgi:hypothetical protein